MTTPYSHDERARSRQVVRRVMDLAAQAKAACERGVILAPETRSAIERLSKTTDTNRQVDALSAFADAVQARHIEKLVPLGQTDFSAFCEIVNPDEPPESKWHVWLCDKLQTIEGDPTLDRFILNCPPGHAKATTLGCPIFTPNGWTTMGAIQVGDELYDDQGKVCHVTWKSPVWKDRPVYTVATDCGDEMVVDAAHEWPVVLDRKPRRPASIRGRYARKNLHPYTIKTTEELAKRRSKRPMIIRAPALEAPEADLPIDPYVLGVWLGDGCERGRSVAQHEDDQVFLRAELERCGQVTTDYAKSQVFGTPGLMTKLKAIGLYRNKRIPPQYLLASPAQRLALLQGLMDTDGTVAPDGQALFAQKDRDLAEEVQFLVRSLGVKATIMESRAVFDGVDHGPYWRVSFYKADACRMPRKRALCRDGARTVNTYITVTPAGRGDTQCIEVSSGSHLFLAGRSMTPTHNPLHVDTPVLMADGGWKRLGDIRPGDSVVSHAHEARRVSAVHEQGRQPLLRLTTVAGRVIHTAPDHSFRVDREGHPALTEADEWMRADAMRPGDILHVVGGSRHPKRTSTTPSADCAIRLAAYVAALGSYTTLKTKTGGEYANVIFWTSDRDTALDIRACLDDQRVAYASHLVRGGSGYSIRIATADAERLDAVYGLFRRAEERIVPDWVFTASPEHVQTYVRTVLDARAERPTRWKKTRLTAYFKSDGFCRDLQRLAASVGLPLDLVMGDPDFGGRSHLWVKAATYDAWAGAPFAATSLVTTHDRVRTVEAYGEGNCRCLTVDGDHTFLADGVVVHNSTYASRLFVAWRMGRNPDLRVIAGGHSQRFVENEFSKKIRNLVSSPDYQKVFPNVLVSHDGRAKDQWTIAGRNGQYVAKGAGGAVHGFRANFIVVDDPYAKIEHAESAVEREKINSWFVVDLGSRILPFGKIFLIMTRFHEEDLTGHLVEMNKRLPSYAQYVLCEAPALCYDPETDVLGRATGEVLWDYYDLSYFAAKKVEWKYQRFALIYQQLADASSDGSIASKFKTYDRAPHRTLEALRIAKAADQLDSQGRPKPDKRSIYRRIVVSVDTAAKKSERADYTVVQVWGETLGHQHYLLDQKREKVEFNAMIEVIEKTARDYEADVILVEDKGQGTAYLQARGKTESQRRIAPCPLVAINPGTQSKEFRFEEVSPMIHEGAIHLPESAPWLDGFIREAGQFPEGAHDDQVDAMTQYLKYAKGVRTRFGSRKVGSLG